jgi:Tfp pilus assembly protein PilF
LLQAGQADEAMAEFRATLKHDPEHTAARQALRQANTP